MIRPAGEVVVSNFVDIVTLKVTDIFTQFLLPFMQAIHTSKIYALLTQII